MFNFYQAIISSPIGKIGIQTNNEKVCRIAFLSQDAETTTSSNPFIKKIEQQLQNYFENSRFFFDLPIDLAGTDLQKKIWHSLQNIPVGKTITYGNLANQLKTGPRVVGSACGRNPIPIIVPCHRVVAKGNLGGFSGSLFGEYTEKKLWLLNHESS